LPGAQNVAQIITGLANHAPTVALSKTATPVEGLLTSIGGVPENNPIVA
jgi:hypothetical protein